MTETTAAATVGRIAWSIEQRAAAQAWKGKRGDGLAVEAACGALAACIALCGEEHPTTGAVSMFAFLTSARGMAYVHERAAAWNAAVNAEREGKRDQLRRLDAEIAGGATGINLDCVEGLRAELAKKTAP